MFSLKETSDEKREMKKGNWTPITEKNVYDMTSEEAKESISKSGIFPPQEYLDTKVKCEKCHWEGAYRKCGFGHNDFICPNCQVESLVQV